MLEGVLFGGCGSGLGRLFGRGHVGMLRRATRKRIRRYRNERDDTLTASKVSAENMGWQERRRMGKVIVDAHRDKAFWDRLVWRARDRGYDLEEAVADKYLALLSSEDEKVVKATADTMMNMRGAKTGDYAHLPITNHKIEINDNRVPEEIAGIRLDVLRKALMGDLKEIAYEGEMEDAEYTEAE